MPPSRLELLPRELREHIYFYVNLPIAGKCIHNCHRALLACELSCDMSVARHPRAKPHYVDIWDEQMRSGGPGLVLLEVRSVSIESGKVEGVDIFKYPAVVHKFKLNITDTGLLRASRFFYNDLLSCFQHPKQPKI